VIGSPGDWLAIPTLANGQPAAAVYLRGGDGTYSAFGLGILTVAPAGIARVTVFGGGADLVARFGFPSIHPGHSPAIARSGAQGNV
jgi:RNA polymerase sigma-70 factor (ECF subfamily)